MAFTYNDAGTTDIDRIRRAINDIIVGEGPLPSGDNFTDAALTDYVTIEGSWQGAVALALETLATAWRTHPTFSADGLSLSNSHISRGFADEAARWRKRFGTGTTTAGVVKGTVADRKDGWYYEYNGVTES